MNCLIGVAEFFLQATPPAVEASCQPDLSAAKLTTRWAIQKGIADGAAYAVVFNGDLCAANSVCSSTSVWLW